MCGLALSNQGAALAVKTISIDFSQRRMRFKIMTKKRFMKVLYVLNTEKNSCINLVIVFLLCAKKSLILLRRVGG